MYESLYSLQKAPFGMNPDPNCLFLTPSHREAFASLVYALSRRKGFVLLTGEAGTGKTSLLRALIQSSDRAQFSLILTPRLDAADFLELVLLDFGVTEVPASKSQRIVRLQEFLLAQRRQGLSPVLVVDEAQALSLETLEEIRLLTNIETAGEKLLQIVLAGQNEMAAVLNQPAMRQLKQRIEMRVELQPLHPSEVRAYMEFRWARAGGQGPAPFSPASAALIARASGGIPRVINCIAENALLIAYGLEAACVEAPHVRQAMADLDLGEPSPPEGPGAAAGGKSPGAAPDRPEVRGIDGGEGAAQARSPKPPLVLRWADEMKLGLIRTRRTKS